MTPTKACSKCRQVKLVSEFSPTDHGDGYQSRCKSCRNSANVEIRAVKKSSITTETCIRCGLEKELSGFKPSRVRRFKARRRCLDCYSEFIRQRNLTTAYSITPEQYEAMERAQEGECAICGEKSDKLFVDHNHKTGLVRGLLCHQCNCGIGFFRESVPAILSAIDYLERTVNV